MNAERIALRLGDDLVASDARYERIAADLAAIRTSTDVVDHIDVLGSFGTQAVLIAFDDETFEAVEAGTYTDWSCHNAWYGGTEDSPLWLGSLGVIEFAAIYHPERIVEAYAGLPGAEEVRINEMIGDGNNISLCKESLEGSQRYTFYEGRGDCPAGCTGGAAWGFDVELDGAVTALDFWEYGDGASVPDMPPPAWSSEPCP